MAGYSVSASSSASSGPSKSGDISGGTAFNIGGINLGTQYPTAATAGGGAASPGELGSLSSDLFPYLLIGGVTLLAVVAIAVFKRK